MLGQELKMDREEEEELYSADSTSTSTYSSAWNVKHVEQQKKMTEDEIKEVMNDMRGVSAKHGMIMLMLLLLLLLMMMMMLMILMIEDLLV